MRQFIALILALVMVFALLPAGISLADSSYDTIRVKLSTNNATASCIYTQKGNKKIRKPQAANQTALIFARRVAARLLSINSIRRLCWS